MKNEQIEQAANEYAKAKNGLVDPAKYYAFIAGANYAMKEGWIDVKERLPDEVEPDGVPVLGVIDSERARGWVYGNVLKVVFFHGKFHLDHKKGYIQNVTHWQTLPSPPIQSEKGA